MSDWESAYQDMMRIGTMHANDGEFVKAIDALKKAIELAPENGSEREAALRAIIQVHLNKRYLSPPKS